MLTIRAHSCSDRGDREVNEDQAAILAAGRVLLVADGMGGQRGGEIASRMAMEAVREWGGAYQEGREEKALLGELGGLFRDANESLMGEVRRDPGLWGLGTTLTLGVIDGQRLYFAHLGDSRLYLAQGGSCLQLTEDHTWAREFVQLGLLTEEGAARSAKRNVLMRFLGTTNEVVPQLGVRDLRGGDRLLLCSDGLYNNLGEGQLALLLREAAEPEGLAAQLVATAKSRGGGRLDNMTALVAAVE